MNIDLLSSIELTASAAIVIAALSITFGSNAATRIRLAAWLSAWFVVVVILAATRALYYEHGLGTPGLGLAVALPIAILCVAVARIKSLREGFHRAPLWLLIGVHTVRLLGIFYCSVRSWPPARSVRSGCGLGRYLCRSNCPTSRMACAPTGRKRSADCMDLEYHRNRGFDRRCRIGRNVFARACALDSLRT